MASILIHKHHNNNRSQGGSYCVCGTSFRSERGLIVSNWHEVISPDFSSFDCFKSKLHYELS